MSAPLWVVHNRWSVCRDFFAMWMTAFPVLWHCVFLREYRMVDWGLLVMISCIVGESMICSCTLLRFQYWIHRLDEWGLLMLTYYMKVSAGQVEVAFTGTDDACTLCWILWRDCPQILRVRGRWCAWLPLAHESNRHWVVEECLVEGQHTRAQHRCCHRTFPYDCLEAHPLRDWRSAVHPQGDRVRLLRLMEWWEEERVGFYSLLCLSEMGLPCPYT